MSKLELRIPPVLVVVIFALIMWLVASFTAEDDFLKPYKWVVFVTLFCAGGDFFLIRRSVI